MEIEFQTGDSQIISEACEAMRNGHSETFRVSETHEVSGEVVAIRLLDDGTFRITVR